MDVYEYGKKTGSLADRLKSFRLRRKWTRQRAKRGFCDADVWAIDEWFLQIMPNMIEVLADNYEGYPLPFRDEYCDINKIDGDAGSIDTYCAAGWKRQLRDMARMFREANEESCSFNNSVEERKIDEYRKKCLDEAMSLFVKWFRHL